MPTSSPRQVGIPFDMHSREAYTEHKLVNCEAALRNSVVAMEANGLSYTLWCYTPDHTEAWGDGWNREDLSVFSRTAAREVGRDTDPAGVYAGGRALRAFVRPFATAVPGACEEPPRFDDESGVFTLRFRHDVVGPPAVVFVPLKVQYADGYDVEVSDGTTSKEAAPAEAGGFELLKYFPSAAQPVHSLTIRRPAAAPEAAPAAAPPKTRARAKTWSRSVPADVPDC